MAPDSLAQYNSCSSSSFRVEGSKLWDSRFRDEHYDLEWLSVGAWHLLQAFDTVAVLVIYSPSKLKNVVAFRGEIEVSIEHRDPDVVELDNMERERS